MSHDEPVGIIGAGMAGIAAAYHLTRAGTPVRIFESRDVIGGRTRTLVEEGTPQPIELGAEFIHGTAEPTLELMERAGVHAESVPDRHVRYARGKFREMGETWSRFARLFEGAGSGRDRSAEEYRIDQHFDREDADLYRLMVEGFEAAPLADVSVQSLAGEAREAAEDPVQFRPQGGYGALLRGMERSLDPEFTHLTLNAVVNEVHWQSDGRCALRVRQGDDVETVGIRRCIVTVPAAVLRSSGSISSISFFPQIEEITRPLSLIGMGQVVKVVMRFRQDKWTLRLPDSDFVHFPSGTFPTLWHERTPAFHQVTAWAGGPKASRLEAFRLRDLIDHAAEELAALTGVAPAEVRSSMLSAHYHDFGHDPFSLGAYPYLRPGGMNAAHELAHPVGGAVFFAGDATDTEYFGTVAGALASGARAAMQVLAA